jgi:hypothetical protein
VSGVIKNLGLVNIGSVGSNFKGLNNLLLVQCNSDNTVIHTKPENIRATYKLSINISIITLSYYLYPLYF